ncbi:hypothetical protein ACS0TY_019512 [Phlomoides rotata]
MSYLCATFLVFLVILSSYVGETTAYRRECNEIYKVKEGETLHSISDKCNDPYILENNPHIQQHDDVFPGLLIKITTSRRNKSRKSSIF